MTTKPKITPVLAVWPHNHKEWRGEEYWGSMDYVNHSDSCSSSWLQLRGISPDRWSNTLTDAWGDLGVYIWLDGDAGGKVMLDLRMHSTGRLDLAQMQLRAQLMSKLTKKAQKSGYPLGCFIADTNPTAELLKFFRALGIGKAIHYQPGRADDVLEPIDAHLLHIGKALGDRVAAMRARRAVAV